MADALALLQRTHIQSAPLIASPRPPDEPFGVADAVVDLQALGLDYLVFEDGHLRIGGMAPLQKLVAAPATQDLANGVLAQAAYLAAHFALRNLATLTGALAGGAPGDLDPSEMLLALLALGAEAVVQGRETRRLALAAWQPAPTELLVEVAAAVPPGTRGALARVARSPLDRPIVAAVAVVKDGMARVAVSGASPRPLVAESSAAPAEAISFLQNAVSAAAQPTGDVRGSGGYRKAMAGVLTRRAVAAALGSEA
jgi:CO/xanthine dehydrogenase FAD-binding subunit